MRKKRQIIEGTIIRRDFPNKGVASNLVKVMADEKEGSSNGAENAINSGDSDNAAGCAADCGRETDFDNAIEGTCLIKNTLPGQRVRAVVTRSGKNRMEARLLEVLEEAPDAIESSCPHFGICGSCHYLSMTYEQELALKEEQVKKLLSDAFKRQETEPVWDGIKKSPIRFEYRNKMEFSFGDEVKDGPLSLGMHKRGSMHDIVTVKGCQIIDSDYRKILTCVLDYFADMYAPLSNEPVTFYHTMQKTGYLRHLLVRKARKTGQILVDLITTTQEEHDLNPLKDALLSLDLDGGLLGLLDIKIERLVFGV